MWHFWLQTHLSTYRIWLNVVPVGWKYCETISDRKHIPCTGRLPLRYEEAISRGQASETLDSWRCWKCRNNTHKYLRTFAFDQLAVNLTLFQIAAFPFHPQHSWGLAWNSFSSTFKKKLIQSLLPFEGQMPWGFLFLCV